MSVTGRNQSSLFKETETLTTSTSPQGTTYNIPGQLAGVFGNSSEGPSVGGKSQRSKRGMAVGGCQHGVPAKGGSFAGGRP